MLTLSGERVGVLVIHPVVQASSLAAGIMGKYERRWHSPYYWDGWDAPGSNLTSLTRGQCPAGSPPSIVCPRCQENPRAGACPEPGPMADLMRLFPRVLIICGGFECARHAGGYWPQDVQVRISTSKPSPMWPAWRGPTG